ncbi:hypothetical protein ESY86_15415 [Subsaximicrobium wynnwilliamsii]|uniref:DUF3108 domain-containing protein n=1 Tax=Subsaximicrobium wynnwilliamsii TaxID=291179 RepID=A0A5C6ZF46_9FLAO|nr:hypothetical protein [Subsaximicrobium wynnwilliamsii]TXD82218.1 hypothetical protein ESY87_15005 [Subsaximicrobium wynnwilliamsii]TXD87858.1 hypothetical protein ESY86_15415 [Subsaximicrobium wynnwilliamsii]TXE01808.1 hypothetical protein ESY88_14580 [Subsaximicrobium wynnwilliamsii]
MKKILILFVVVMYLAPQNLKAQNDGAAVATVAGGLLAIGAGIAAIEQMKEQAELTATEWFLTNHPEYNKFSLKTLDFDGKKLKDMSSTSVITFKIREFDIKGNEPELGKKLVLFGFTSYGWINEYGIDFSKVEWFLIDSNEWMNMMTAYTKVASSEKNEGTIRGALKDGKVVNKGVKVKNREDIDFYKIEGDMYLVTDYSPEMKFIYNERSLGIYLKETMNLIQIGRGNLINIHEFFFDE